MTNEPIAHFRSSASGHTAACRKTTRQQFYSNAELTAQAEHYEDGGDFASTPGGVSTSSSGCGDADDYEA